MAHSAQPDGPPRRTRDYIIGVLCLIAAIALIVVVVFALRHPKGPHAANEASAGALSSSPSTSVSKSVAAPTTSATTASTPPSTPVSTTTPTTSTTSTTPTTAVTSTTTPATNVAPASVRLPIIVLNNTAADGAAALATSRFQAGGWQATNGGNFSGDILSTVAYYNPNADGSLAAAEALQKQFPAIKRVRPFITGLPDAPVVVVLTSDYS